MSKTAELARYLEAWRVGDWLELSLEDRKVLLQKIATWAGSKSRTLRGGIAYLKNKRYPYPLSVRREQDVIVWQRNRMEQKAKGMLRALGLWEKDKAEELANELTDFDYDELSNSLPKFSPYHHNNPLLKCIIRIEAQEICPNILYTSRHKYHYLKPTIIGEYAKKSRWHSIRSTRRILVNPIWVLKYGDLLKVKSDVVVSLSTETPIENGVRYVGWGLKPNRRLYVDMYHNGDVLLENRTEDLALRG